MKLPTRIIFETYEAAAMKLLAFMQNFLNLCLSILVLVVALRLNTLGLGDLLTDSGESGLALLASAYALISLLVFTWHRLKEMNKLDGIRSLEVYGEVTRIRGRDFFGPIVTEEPAEAVTIVLTVHQINGDHFSYTLSYEILLPRKLASPINLELAATPVYYFNDARYATFRHETPEPGQLTLDSAPVVEKDLLSILSTKRHECTQELARANLNAVSARPLGSDDDYTLRSAGVYLVIAPLETEPFKVPALETQIPRGTKAFEVNFGPLQHPMKYNSFRVSSPLRTKVLSFVARTNCQWGAGYVLHAGECSNVERQKLEGENSILADKAVNWKIAKGYSWKANPSWIITPGDWIDVYFTKDLVNAEQEV